MEIKTRSNRLPNIDKESPMFTNLIPSLKPAREEKNRKEKISSHQFFYIVYTMHCR
jgi:hypothetical protein